MNWMLSEGKTFSVGGVGNIPGNKVAAISAMLALGQAVPGLGHWQGDSDIPPVAGHAALLSTLLSESFLPSLCYVSGLLSQAFLGLVQKKAPMLLTR